VLRLLSAVSVRKSFRPDKHLASYARWSSCEVPVVLVMF
jgi:hypothetical protein